MKNSESEKLFDGQFKFQLNQDVRHKGDNKEKFSNDLGLLILQRELIEEADDNGNRHFTRQYICRMIRFSGSGDMARFKESELMTVEEYERKKVEQDRWRDQIHQEMHETLREIMDAFGVKRGTKVHLVNDEKKRVYKVTGYTQSHEGTELSLRETGGIGSKSTEVKVKTKEEFVVVGPPDKDGD